MISIPVEQRHIRFRRLPSQLQDLVFDEREDEIVDLIGTEFGLDFEKKQKIANVCLLVFLGFLSINDVGKEIAESLQLDRAIAEKISGKLYDRIFAFVKEEIQANYKPEFTPDEEKKPEPEETIETTNSPAKDEPVFLLNSLAPLENSLNTSHPEATPIPPKPTTQEEDTPKTKQEAPVALYSESEVVPIKETIEITGPASVQTNLETPPKPYTGPASVQFGGFEIPKPSPQEKKEASVTSAKNNTPPVPEFIPSPITTKAKDVVVTPITPQSESKKETLSDAPKFIALEADPTPQAPHISTEKTAIPTSETAKKPVVMNFTEKPVETNEIKKNEVIPQETTPTAPKGLFGKLSSMVLGLGEKPAPIQNRTFGPPTINAKVIDYGMPKPEQPQQAIKETEKTKEEKTSEFFAIPLEPTPKKQEATQTQDSPTINPVVNLKKPTNGPVPPPPPYKN